MNNQQKHTWLTSLLTGWGLKESWAKVLAGAVIGALCAAGFLTSCTASYSQTAAGDLSARISIVEPQPYCK